MLGLVFRAIDAVALASLLTVGRRTGSDRMTKLSHTKAER
jgi:hypothetical protein